jgi:hypothetical protein
VSPRRMISTNPRRSISCSTADARRAPKRIPVEDDVVELSGAPRSASPPPCRRPRAAARGRRSVLALGQVRGAHRCATCAPSGSRSARPGGPRDGAIRPGSGARSHRPTAPRAGRGARRLHRPTGARCGRRPASPARRRSPRPRRRLPRPRSSSGTRSCAGGRRRRGGSARRREPRRAATAARAGRAPVVSTRTRERRARQARGRSTVVSVPDEELDRARERIAPMLAGAG